MKQFVLYGIAWLAFLAAMIIPVLIAASRKAIPPTGSTRAGADKAASPPDKQS